MEQYIVTGMSCAACSARVEKAVSGLAGVTGCSVNLLTNSMGVEGTAPPSEIIAAVEAAGYGASRQGDGRQPGTVYSSAANHTMEEMLQDKETPIMKKRLTASVCLLLPLMYVSMGHMMWGWPLPQAMAENHLAMGLFQLLLTTAIMVINQKFFINGFRGLLHRAPNMDTLVAMGAAASYIYSLYALFAMTDAVLQGDHSAVMGWMHEFYFESAATILTLITVGKMLEARSKGKTTDAIKGLLKLAPKTATVLRDGQETTLDISQVQQGDIFTVRPGENIPVDGIVLEGSSAVNESALTGESIPVDKEPGNHVSAATTNQSGFLKCQATRVGQDTTLSQIIQMVSDAAATKAPIAKIADRVSGIFVPAVIAIAAITIAIWLLAGQTAGFALARGISVLVISCPCALGLATPVAIMVGNGVAARHGVMFKTAVSLEEAGKTNIVALDKTGTITKGEPRVTDIFPAEGITEQELLTKAFSLERCSEHPLAKAIVHKGDENGITPQEIEDFTAVPGNGLQGRLGETLLYGGNLSFVESKLQLPYILKKQAEALGATGKTALFFAQGSPPDTSLWDCKPDGKQADGKQLDGKQPDVKQADGKQPDEKQPDSKQADGKQPNGKQPDNGARSLTGGRALGIIGVADIIKEDSPAAIKELQKLDIQVVMLTGDNEGTARTIGKQAGVNEVIAEVLPDGKEQVIRSLQGQGKVAMVGDGINDAPALTRADIGIAIGTGTDIAIDAADVVLMKSRLSDVPLAIRLSKKVIRNIKENLFWAFIYNVIGIPLAAGLWYPVSGLLLNPMFAAAAMSLSSVCVVTNALRLRGFRAASPSSGNGPSCPQTPGPDTNSVNSADSTDSTNGTNSANNTNGTNSANNTNGTNSANNTNSTDSANNTNGTNNTSSASSANNTNSKIEMEEKEMEKTLYIDGMMCAHCQKHVEDALNGMEGVKATVDLENKCATVTMEKDIPMDEFDKVITQAGYTLKKA